MSREISALARYRFRRANAAYRDGVSLFRKGSYESALNRFYYAAFYSARALLALKRLDASKHSGVSPFLVSTLSKAVLSIKNPRASAFAKL